MKLAIIAMLFLSACASIDPYRPPPATCTALDAERSAHNARIDRVEAARTAKQIGTAATLGAVALGALAPPFALAGPVLGAITIDIEGDKARNEFLAIARLHMDCE